MPTNLVFLFMSQSSASPGTMPDDWCPSGPCGDAYHERFANEGYFKLLEELLTAGIIDRLSIFYESNIDPGVARWVNHPKAYCAVIPEIRFAEKYIDEDTIIWARGGFKHWHDWLLRYKCKGNWLLLYAANTGRQRWPLWDVVLDDLEMRPEFDRHERLTVPFIKPIDDAFFCPIDIPYEYDVCIGASHIHDKKGQWRAIEAVARYEALYGERLRVIMPGAIRGAGAVTKKAFSRIINGEVKIDTTGHVSRASLREIFNKSRLAVFPGAHGQNDRGPLEALACGRPVLIGFPGYHSSALLDLKSFVKIPDNPDNLDEICLYIRAVKAMSYRDPLQRKIEIASQFKARMGFDKSVAEMAKLIAMISGTEPTAHRKKIIYEAIRRDIP